MAMIATKMQPSFYYLVIAKTCFQRSRATPDRTRSRALCELGRSYLVKAEMEAETGDGRRGN